MVSPTGEGSPAVEPGKHHVPRAAAHIDDHRSAGTDPGTHADRPDREEDYAHAVRARSEMGAVADALAAINLHDLNIRLPARQGDDEIARLTRAINEMLDRLDQSRHEAHIATQRQRRFASDASHEVLTPLAGLRAELEEARLHPDQTDLRELLEYALSDVERLQRITGDLLVLARSQEGPIRHWEQLDLGELVREDLAKRAVPHEAILPADESVMVDADRARLSRMFGILLDNAERHARKVVEVRVAADADTAQLIVSDDGAGIGKADRERIFEPFTRLDECRSRTLGGTGLGLAIARQIAQAHGGTLIVEESPLGGAQFVLRLPVAAPSPVVWQGGIGTLGGTRNNE